MNFQQLSNEVAAGAIALFALAALIVGLRVWVPSLRQRGVQWEIELLILLAGPVCVTTAALAGDDTTASSGGPADLLNRLARYTVVALSAASLVRMARQRRAPRLPIISVLVFYSTIWLSAAFGYIPAFPEQYWTTPLAVLAIAADGRYSREQLVISIRSAARILLIISLAAALVLPELAFRMDDARNVFGVARLQGLTGHPNNLGFIVTIGILLEAHTRSRIAWRFGFLAALILAQSSTAYVMIAVCFMFVANPGTRLVRVTGTAVASLAGVLYLLAPEIITSIITDHLPAEAATLTGRTNIWDAAMNGFNANPIFGYGPNLLDDEFRWLYLPGFDAAAQAHNQLVQTLAGQGLVGVGSLVILTLILITGAWKTRRSTGGLSLALVAALTIRCVTETPLRPTNLGFDVLFFAFLIAYLSGPAVGQFASIQSKRNESRPIPDRAGAHMNLPLP